MILRGDIYYVMAGSSVTGSEQEPGRPAIVVSNNVANEHSPVVEVVFLTTKPKRDLPTHVDIYSTSRHSIALCEQITSVSVERIGDYGGCCTPDEMKEIDNALYESLGLQPPVKNPFKTYSAPVNTKELDELRAQLEHAQRERDLYKTMYETTIQTVLRRP